MRPFSNLSTIVHRRTYSRVIDGRPESWRDTVERVIAGNVRGHNVPEKEIKRLRHFMMERKASPAGRGLWISGTSTQERIGGAGLVNCWFLTADDWMNFVMAQDLLMLGGGVGLSVEREFVSKLPRVKRGVVITHKPTKDADFIIPDSREGWCELLRRVLQAFFEDGKGFTYSTVCLRPAGEPIRSFGGVASGPRPLVAMVEKLCALFVAREGRQLRPIDAADVICSIGEMVVSGNVRRSAIIIIGDAWDREYLKAKRWDLGDIPTQRSKANFSVVAEDPEHDLRPLFWETYKQGEPFGLINRKNMQTFGRMGEVKRDAAIGVNPCVTSDTWVLTGDGYRQVYDLVGRQFTAVVNGKPYRSTEPGFWSTGVKPVFEVETQRGYKLRLTGNHQLLTDYGSWVKLQNLRPGDKIRLSEHYSGYESYYHDENKGWLLGELIGDGTFMNADCACLDFWGETAEDVSGIAFSIIKKHLRTRSDLAVRPQFQDGKLRIACKAVADLAREYGVVVGNKVVTPEIERASEAFQVGVIRGLFDADGSVQGDHEKGVSVRLCQSSLATLEAVQRMLLRRGIISTIYKNRRDEGVFSLPDGHGGYSKYWCRATHELVVSRHGLGLYAETIGFNDPAKKQKLEALLDGYKRPLYKQQHVDTIKSITPSGEEEVYDCTIPEAHEFCANGLRAHNCAEICLEDGEPCNLQDICLPFIKSVEEFEEAAVLMHRYGKRVTCEPYHWEKAQRVIAKNRRIGTGITGCLESPLFTPEVLDRVYQAIQRENVAYSKEVGIPESVRNTTIKPSGSLSKLFGTPCEGLHSAYSRYIIQRIRFSATDPTLKALREAGHHMEPELRLDGSRDHGTTVVDFYLEVPEGTPQADKDYDTWKQLETVKMAQRYWADNSVSVTVYYQREDVPKLKTWVQENLSELKTISFLAHQGHGFRQAPKEPITKAQYEELSKEIKPINPEDVYGDGTLDGLECEGGACPVR